MKEVISKIFLFSILLIGLFSCDANTSKGIQERKLKNGDIIFQTSLSSQSMAIQLATKSEYSHVGIIYIENGKAFVYEAVEPVKITPIKEWIVRGKNKKYLVKRLKSSENILTSEVVSNMKNVGKKHLGKHYDLYFEWSDDRIYCSELVWKIYKEATGLEVGKLQKLKDFDISNEIVKKKLFERYGENIPLNEVVISPSSIFESSLLEEVSF